MPITDAQVQALSLSFSMQDLPVWPWESSVLSSTYEFFQSSLIVAAEVALIIIIRTTKASPATIGSQV